MQQASQHSPGMQRNGREKLRGQKMRSSSRKIKHVQDGEKERKKKTREERRKTEKNCSSSPFYSEKKLFSLSFFPR